MKNKEIVIIIGAIILILVGGYGSKSVEPFNFLDDTTIKGKKIGSNLNATDCQNKCAELPNCKYVQRPSSLELWDKGDCYITEDDYQYKVGDMDDGSMKTWKNKNWVKPEPPEYVPPWDYGDGTSGYPTFSTRSQAKQHCKQKIDNKGRTLSLCHSDQVREYKDSAENLCNSGWTVDKRGWWVGRYRGWGCGPCGNHSHYWNSWHSTKSSAHCCANMQNN